MIFTLKVLLKWEVGLSEIYLEILFSISISFLADISPAYLVEERVVLDGFYSANFTESLRGILLQETLDQAQRVAREMGDAKVRRDDIFLHLNLVVVVVWWKTSDQLVQQHSQAVVVQGPAVMLVAQDFWAEVFRTATYGFGLIKFGEVLLRKSKVCQLQMTPFIDQDIFRLQVSIEDVMIMKMLDCKNNLSEQKPGLFWCKVLMPLDEVEQITTWA